MNESESRNGADAAAEPEVVETIEAAPLGVTAIFGHSRLGPTGEARTCDSESDYNKLFGDFADGPTLAAAIHGFFQNGGKRCVVVNLGERERPLEPGDLAKVGDDRDIELVCAPGKTAAADYQHLLSHCAERRTRLALLDGPEDLSRQMHRLRPPESSNGAFYVPWLLVQDPARAEVVRVPPSGHVAGLMARVGRERGPHKAPANEPLLGITGLADEISQAEQDILHPRKINCIRRLPKLEGIRPWGAQTLTRRGPFASIPTLRLYGYVVRSFETARRWLVNRTNEPDTWRRFVEAGEAFLDDLRQSGALVGETPEEAYRLRCDAELNDARARDQGLLMFEVGLALARPGAFFSFKMGLDMRAD